MSLNKLNILNKLLNFLGVKSYRQIDDQKINDIISLLKPYDAGIPLIRVGEDTDGGYLLPDILNDIDYCFSPGVGNSSSFEKSLESYGIKSFLADKSVDGPAEKRGRFKGSCPMSAVMSMSGLRSFIISKMLSYPSFRSTPPGGKIN